MTTFSLTVDDAGVRAAFLRLSAAARDPSPALRAIGEVLLPQVRQTFATSTDPWGRPWAPNSDATLRAMLHRGTGNFTQRGGLLSAKAHRALASKKPLIGAGRILSRQSLNYAVSGHTLTLYSSAAYAAMQQFGGQKSQFPHLWGDIPARPFLPVTPSGALAPAASRVVVEKIQEYLLPF